VLAVPSTERLIGHVLGAAKPMLRGTNWSATRGRRRSHPEGGRSRGRRLVAEERGRVDGEMAHGAGSGHRDASERPPAHRRQRQAPRLARLVAFLRDDAGLSGGILLAGSALLVVGSLLPWIRGSTRYTGNIDWNGLSDTGDGLMLMSIAVIIAAAVRYRRTLAEIEPGSRWIPLVVAIAAACLWQTARWKADLLTYPGFEAGARPQIGLLVVAIGVLFCIVGGWLFSRERAVPPDAPPGARR
jgi:hypothetical protein